MMSFGLTTPALAKEVDRVPSEVRLSHAKELLGNTYKRKVVRKNEATEDIQNFVKATTLKFLPKEFKSKSGAVSEAILDAANEFELDPVFLMAVIQNESSFNPKRKGTVGEIGLMQILPKTAEWIAGLYDLEYHGAKSLYQPEVNVWIGAALMDKLRHQFDSASRLYVSAYNVGPKKLRKMISENKKPKEYVQAVMKRYIALYSGFQAKGDSKVQSKAAWENTINLTKKLAKN